MKKVLILALLPILLLAGCVAQETPEPTETVQTTPPGLYVSESDIEKQTDGAVRLYELPEGSYCWISNIGNQLLLASDGDTAGLMVLTGADCVPATKLHITPELFSGTYSVLQSGFAYYDQAENQAIFLDSQLKDANRVTLHENISGQPVFSPTGDEVFYCVGQEVRALDMERRISRLIKSHSYEALELLGCYFDGKILACRTVDKREGEQIVYISSETGETMRKENGITALYTYSDSYFLHRKDGLVDQQIFGKLNDTAQGLNIAEPNVAAALELGGIVGYKAEDSVTELAFYDLESCKKTASVQLHNAGTPKAFLADRWTGCIWILTDDPESGSNALLRWDKKASALENADVSCLGLLFTAQAPDKAGLEACEDRISVLNKAHGVRIRIWQDAVEHNGGHIMMPEYQAPAIQTVLDQLEKVLSEFPKNFLKNSISSKIRICIVRSIDGESKAVQYWNEDDAYITLSVGVDVRDEFLKGLGYIVDSHVLGNSSKYDKWNNLNPEGFAYGKEDSKYLEGEERAFADELSMRTAVDDRSRIFYEAMQPENADMFRSKIMQNKLLLLCQGIRDAWKLKRKEQDYIWEQYLTESIAYKK